MKNRNRKLLLACALAAAGAMPMLALSGNLNISTDPLGTGASSIKPNVMFILDDSGSMASDYMPDYVNDGHNPPGTTGAAYGVVNTFVVGSGAQSFEAAAIRWAVNAAVPEGASTLESW